MYKFYGTDIEKISEEFLLKATPFVKDTRINFMHKLTPEIFFENLYTGRITDADTEINKENLRFECDINNALTCFENKFAKVDLIHIAGYGGCGKTTFLRYLLWNLGLVNETNDIVIDFEGEKKIDEPLVHWVATMFSENTNDVLKYFNRLLKNEIFNLNRFRDVDKIGTLLIDIEELIVQGENVNREEIKSKIYKQQEMFSSYEKYCYNLMLMGFLLQIYKYINEDYKKPIVIAFDNVDSISDLEEEKTLVLALKEFINDCNFFFGMNVENEKIYENQVLSDIIARTKFIFFLTTRMITIKRYLELEPDLENVYGWVSLKMPEHYYNHRAIINKRATYYKNMEEGKNGERIQALINIKNFANIVYRNYNFKRLFNGNIRFCLETLCKINRTYSATSLIKESMQMYEMKSDCHEVLDGASGIVLGMLFNYFKDNGVYSEKLHLSECRCDYRISLSRIILTVIREKGGSCSLLEIFKLLTPFFGAEDICNVVWDLSEESRECWRRLITFNLLFPQNPKELQKQAKLFLVGNVDIEQYTELNLCIAGLAYMDCMVPHFEFMLSRHKYTVDNVQNENYQPLFCRNSEDRIQSDDPGIRYRFERKIDWVYEAVADCCVNSTHFAKKVMDEFHLSREEFVNNTYFNYHATNRDGTAGARRSYESRLIFSHIGYIERYRRYLLFKNRSKLSPYLREINEKLVVRIKRYLDLYCDSERCFHTPEQDEATKELYDYINIISKTNYFDFSTKIEVLN